MITYTPYTYLIGWSSLNMWYYGVRYALKCAPDDLWKTYFTSSKHVHRFEKLHGPPDIIQVRKIFTNANQAINWENKVLKRMKVVEDNRFLNRTYNKGISTNLSSWTKGKTYEELYGIDRATTLRKMRSKSNSIRKVKWNYNSKQNASRRPSGGGNSRARCVTVRFDDGEIVRFDCIKSAATYAVNKYSNNKLENVVYRKSRGIQSSKQHNFKKLYDLLSSYNVNMFSINREFYILKKYSSLFQYPLR